MPADGRARSILVDECHRKRVGIDGRPLRNRGAQGQQERWNRPRKVRLTGRPVTRLSMVEPEESAEAIAPLHGGGRALRRCRLLQKPVVESLVVSLAVIVLDVLPREEAQVAVTERDHSIETFFFD